MALCNKILLFYDCMLLNCGDFFCFFVDHDKNETFNIFYDLIKSIVTCLLDLKKLLCHLLTSTSNNIQYQIKNCSLTF